MSKEERFDIAIGILDPTENAIERIKNQHKFEKDLSEFLNTNTYSKDKAWVVGLLNQVSEYCKDKIDTLMENQQRIAELEEQLKNAIVPKFKRGQIVWCVYPENIYRKGFVFAQEFIGYTKDRLLCGECVGETEEFGLDEVFTTKEEAQAKLEELKGDEND